MTERIDTSNPKPRAGKGNQRRQSAERRREQILEAFFRCVASRGLKESTIADVADESGLQRTLIYHYFQDRESLIDSLIDYVMNRTQLGLFKAISGRNSAGSASRLDQTLDYFFGDGYGSDEDFLVFAEIVLVALRDKQVRERVGTVFHGWHRFIAHELHEAFPESAEKARRSVAYAITLMAEQNAYLMVIDPSEERNVQARLSARLLLDALRDGSTEESDTRKEGQKK